MESSGRRQTGVRHLDPNFVWPEITSKRKVNTDIPKVSVDDDYRVSRSETRSNAARKSNNNDNLTRPLTAVPSTTPAGESKGEKTVSKDLRSEYTRISKSSKSIADIERKKIALEIEQKKQIVMEEVLKQKQSVMEEVLKQKQGVMEEVLKQKLHVLEMEKQLREAEVVSESNYTQSKKSDKNFDSVSTYTTYTDKIQNWVNDLPEKFSNENCEPNQFESKEINVRQKDKTDIEILCETLANVVNIKKNEEPDSRRYLERDFPIFDGNSADWPLFISHFTRISTACKYTNEEKMIKLQKCLRGEARSAVIGMLISPHSLDTVIKTLEMRFGRPDQIIETIMYKVTMTHPVRENDYEGMIKFSNQISCLVSTIKSLNCISHLQNPQLLKDLVQKLPESLKFRWGEFIMKNRNADLAVFADWLLELSNAASFVIPPKNRYRLKPKEFAYTTREKEEKCTFCQENGHKIEKCRKFEKEDIDSRWKFITDRKLCFSCFKSRHQTSKCQQKKICNINGCKQGHNKLLHKDKPEEIKQNVSNVRETLLAMGQGSKNVLLRMVSVLLHGPSETIETVALCDEAATVTLMDSSLADRLGVRGENVPLCVQWTNDMKSTHTNSRCFDINISGIHRNARITKMTGVRSINNLALPEQHIYADKMRSYSHLTDIPFTEIKQRPMILIGQDNIHLTVARKVCEGPLDSPIATKTTLGWIVHGRAESTLCHRNEFTFHICHQESYDKLPDLVQKESFGVCTPKISSKSDTTALEILERTAKSDLSSQLYSRNTSRERHLSRTASKEKQPSRNVSQERLPSRNLSREKKSSSRNPSQDSRTSSQDKRSRRIASQEKHHNRNCSPEKQSGRKSLQEKQCSRNSSQEKVPATKVPVTSNQFDRVLYANADRVLYPPRRKVGRPPVSRRPGRPPKHRSEPVEMKSVHDQSGQSLKGKARSKSVVLTTKQTHLKAKSVTLKVPKIFHSKHKHKHKKRKFKLLKQSVSSDPKINQEIEKLIVDFVKFCAIATKQPKENVPEQILKTLKKVTKKRRTTDHVEKKKKKQSVSTTVNKVNNSNEQRLPLKKRHYHLVSNSSETQKMEAEESKEKVPDKVEEVKTEVRSKMEKKEKVKEKEGKITPKYVPVIKSHMNNNEYEVKAEKHEKEATAHIEEAIEACINKFVEKKAAKNEEPKIIPATTPKKRHRLENLQPDAEDVQKSKEILPEIKTELVSASVEDKLEKFKTNITVESFINELKIKRNLMSQKSASVDVEETDRQVEDEACDVEVKKEVFSVLQVEKYVQVSPENTKKKVRKRRAINRTGFPSVKKKKKKVLASGNVEAPAVDNKDVNNVPVCDRVPKEGEEYTTFLQRSAGNSVQDRTTIRPPADDAMSECESLPQDERIDFDLDDSSRSESIADNDSRRSKRSDGDDNESMSLLESSIERLKSRLDQKKRKRTKDLKHIPVETNTYPKRRRREDSPASSIEPSVENRLRDSASASGDEFTKKSKKTPKWRKKYLPAGLFSDYYKEDESKRQENSKSTRNLAYNPDDHPYGLLPPPYHCGKYLRCRRVDFQLPYDLWWQHTHSQLPGRDVVPSWNYRKIRTNVYNVKTNGGTCEPQSCNCKASSNCGDDCINRLVLAECPASHRCNNQKIQKHDWAAGIEKFMTENKGWGVRTKEPIKQGDFILEYVGEVVSDQEFKERMHSIYVNDTHHYCLHLDGGLVIDGHRMGSDGRFVNHSCQPNCEIQKWSVNGQFRMALFALRDIDSYEELTYDYNFSLFNPAEGQECKCGSEKCRGVIGGKTQRIRQLPESAAPKNPGRVGRPRKTEAKKKLSKDTGGVTSATPPPPPTQVVPQIQVKPMSHQQKCFILEHHCFLLRNLTKVRKVRDRSQSVTSTTVSRQQTATPTDTSAFMNQLNALQKPRNMKTRRVAQAEDDPELSKTVRLAAVLRDILVAITSARDDNSQIISASLMQLPSKRKAPEFYQQISNPIDLSTIEQNIATGIYKTPEAFDEDMTKLFSGFSKFYGRASDAGIAAAKLKKIYAHTKLQSLAKFEDVLGLKPPPTFVNRKKNQEEDIIRCICGIPRDEGLMIQCERCMVWQHTECVKADGSAASYHCEVCVPRQVNYEISMDEFTEHGHRYFMTLMRGDLQLRQGDTVYVLRDIPITGTKEKHTYKTIGDIDYSELDIFRIEALWKDKDTGKRFAYGHHYLRPHETFHEPTRKFFPNEVMRVPLYEAVSVDLIMEHCWVMDLNTFCKGRPIGALEKHVYICEYRVDKGAKMFSKASRSKFPTCTKSFAFECFETRMKMSRTYCPHDVDVSLLKNGGAGRKRVEKDKDKDRAAPSSKESTGNNASVAPAQPGAPPVQRTPAQQKTRLNKLLLNLLGKMPTKQVVDVSYLLEGGRRRKKQEAKQ